MTRLRHGVLAVTVLGGLVGDRVFVVAARSLQALSAQTGATLWSVPLGRPARLAYRLRAPATATCVRAYVIARSTAA